MNGIMISKWILTLNSVKREYKNSVARGGRQRETTSTHLHFPSLRRHVRDDSAIMDLPQGRELIIINISEPGGVEILEWSRFSRVERCFHSFFEEPCSVQNDYSSKPLPF